MNQRNTCRLCGKSSFSERTSFLGTTEKYKDASFVYARCLSCRTINNLSLAQPDYSGYLTGENVSQRKVQRFLNLLQQLKIKKEELILDYGCGKGALLSSLQKNGYINVDGYEPFNPNYAQTINSGKKYTLIYLTHVFEHLEDLPYFFADMEKLTIKGSKIITIHPSSSRIPSLDSNCVFQSYTFHAPFHTFIPSDDIVLELFAKRGFKLVTKYPFDIQRSGFRDNNRVSALLTRTLGGTKEKVLLAPNKQKYFSVFKAPLAFLNSLIFHTRDHYSSTFIFEKI